MVGFGNILLTPTVISLDLSPNDMFIFNPPTHAASCYRYICIFSHFDLLPSSMGLLAEYLSDGKHVMEVLKSSINKLKRSFICLGILKSILALSTWY